MGAKVIRAYEKEHGLNVPWTILLQLNRPGERTLDLAQLVAQGQTLGIYAYFLFVGEQTADWDGLLAVIGQCHSSAFFLISGDEPTNRRMADCSAPLRNTLFVPRGGIADLPDISAALVQKKRMFSLNCEYNASNAEMLLSDAFLQKVVDWGYPFLLLVPAPDCDPETRARVYADVLRVRGESRYALFPIDLYTDVQQVDHIISDERCMLEIGSDGSLLYPASADGLNVADQPLEELIRLTMPRVRRHR